MHLLILRLPECLHWPFCPGVFIAILAFVAAAVTFRETSQREKSLWVSVFLLLLACEVWMMSRDRERNDNEQDAARKRQEENFRLIGEGIKSSFAATMSQFAIQTKTLAKLQAENRLLTQKVLDTPVSSLSTKALADEARAVAQQMRTYLYSYQDTDMIRGIIAHDQLREREPKMTQKEMEEWEKKDETRRVALRTEYETGAKEIIATANHLRAEMVKRLVPLNRGFEDTTRVAWFQNPTSDNTYTWLHKLNENADYLDNLATRVLWVP